MGSRNNIGSLAVRAAVSLAVAASCAACSSCAGDPRGRSTAGDGESGGDARPTFDSSQEVAAASATDALDNERDAGDPCAPTVGLTPDCVHPYVVTQCDAGWCFIPHGCFIMGSPPCEFGRGRYDEDQVRVTLTHDFEMQQTEMTQSGWTALGFGNPSAQKDAGFMDGGWGDGRDPQCPVGNVMLVEAMAAANALSRTHTPPLPECYALSGCVGAVGASMKCDTHALTMPTAYQCQGYRLPTEAEWEYAARAGTRGALYSGDIARTLACAPDPNLQAIGWYCYNANGYSQRVAQKQANGWGLYDMSGNAHEWTSSAFTAAGYGSGPLENPMADLAKAADIVVVRGGLANYSASVTRSADRSGFGFYDLTGPLRGFRLVRTLSGISGAADAAAE